MDNKIETNNSLSVYNSDINTETLTKNGKLSYEWALQSMKIITKLKNKYKSKKPLSGLKIGFCLHITKETSVLLMAVKELGAKISLCSANPLSVQLDILHFLQNNEIQVFAHSDENEDDFFDYIKKVIRTSPDIITDDGAELHLLAHESNLKAVMGGTEETTSGINRLSTLFSSAGQLDYPIIGVNYAYTKHLFDNRFGTAQSSLDGIFRTTGILVPGKKIVICGYGWVGKGLSSFLRALGARVTVCEVDPIKALEAHMNGFEVTRLDSVVSKADFCVTCTGQTDVIRKEHVDAMKDGIFLANAGHFDVEIDVNYLREQDRNPTRVRKFVDCYKINGKKIYLLCNGRVVNLIGAEGNPPEVMALSFANQLLSILYITKNHNVMEKKLYNIPEQIDKVVAYHALESFDIKIDKLSKKQIKYYKNLKSISL